MKNELDITSPLGGVVEEIGHFQRGMLSIRSHGSFFWHHLLGAMLRKLAIFKMGKYDHMVPIYFLARRETNHAWLEKIVSRLS